MQNMNWVNKLKISAHEEDNGPLTITIEWDETDPDLKIWTDWGEQLQKEFILTTLHDACDHALNNDT